MTEKSLTERMMEILGDPDTFAKASESFGRQHPDVRAFLDSEIDFDGSDLISLRRKREPTFSKPKIVFVSPTGRLPREPEMQHLGKVVHLDIETYSTADFSKIEERVLALTGIDDVIRKQLAGSVERETARAIYGDGMIPQERRYSPVPEKGNRAERRRKAAQNRRKP